jgi:hypothetical protein
MKTAVHKDSIMTLCRKCSLLINHAHCEQHFLFFKYFFIISALKLINILNNIYYTLFMQYVGVILASFGEYVIA